MAVHLKITRGLFAKPLPPSDASGRRAPRALARTVMPAFTDYIRDVSQFREFERKLLVLAGGGAGGMTE